MQKKILIIISLLFMNTYLHCAENKDFLLAVSQVKTLLQEMIAAAKRQKYNQGLLSCCRPVKTIKAEDIDIHKYFDFNFESSGINRKDLKTPQLYFFTPLNTFSSLAMPGWHIELKKKYRGRIFRGLITQDCLSNDKDFKAKIALSDKQPDMFDGREMGHMFYMHQVQQINGFALSALLVDLPDTQNSSFTLQNFV